MVLQSMAKTVCNPLSAYEDVSYQLILIPNAPGIRSLHINMWETIKRRLHRPLKVFPFGDRAMEFVVIGTVEWWVKDGNYSKLNMAGHFKSRRKIWGRGNFIGPHLAALKFRRGLSPEWPREMILVIPTCSELNLTRPKIRYSIFFAIVICRYKCHPYGRVT